MFGDEAGNILLPSLELNEGTRETHGYLLQQSDCGCFFPSFPVVVFAAAGVTEPEFPFFSFSSDSSFVILMSAMYQFPFHGLGFSGREEGMLLIHGRDGERFKETAVDPVDSGMRREQTRDTAAAAVVKQEEEDETGRISHQKLMPKERSFSFSFPFLFPHSMSIRFQSLRFSLF